MKFAVVGAGAIGAYVGARLWAAGEEVALIARGAHLAAIRKDGVQVIQGESETLVATPFATEDPAEVGPADVVILSLKTPGLQAMAPHIHPLLGENTPILTAQNGIPWWYFQSHGGALEGTRLNTVDPDGVLASTFSYRRIIGCVIYCSATVVRPGVVKHVEGNRFAIGEPDGSASERCREISRIFQRAGLKCPVRGNIRHDIWVKLIGNLAFNPISALTRSDLAQILSDSRTLSLCRSIMQEGEEVAGALGLQLGIPVQRRIDGASRVGPHKTSMLQDLEARKPLELDSIVGAVVELADILGLAVPHVKTVYGCAKLLEKRMLENTDRSK